MWTKIKEGLYGLGNQVICIVGSVIFLFLSVYSFFSTQYMNPLMGGYEFPQIIADSKKRNILMLLGFICFIATLLWVEKRLSEKVKLLLVRRSLVLAVAWIAIIGFWWINAAERVPGADQAFLCNAATAFRVDDYGVFAKGYYCDQYPYQVSIISFLEMLASFTDNRHVQAFQILNVVFAAGIVCIGYGILKELIKEKSILISYNILMMGCFPIVGYTSWIYGELISIFFSELSVLLLMKYLKSNKAGFLIGFVATMTMAFLMRRNSIILIIAICLSVILWNLKKLDKKILFATLCMIIVPIVVSSGIQKMYEVRSGVERSEGIPTISFVAMGLIEADGRYGWDNGYQTQKYAEYSSDSEATKAACMIDFKERVRIFAEQPSYAVRFFKEKQLSQWNAPLYQALYFSTNYAEDNPPSQDSLIWKINSGNYFSALLHVCDGVQFVLYFGMLLYYLLAVRKESNIMYQIFPVMIIGGFLFSMIWEAKARYILPYYVVMFPIAVVGYRQFVLQGTVFFRKILLAIKKR